MIIKREQWTCYCQGGIRKKHLQKILQIESDYLFRMELEKANAKWGTKIKKEGKR